MLPPEKIHPNSAVEFGTESSALFSGNLFVTNNHSYNDHLITFIEWITLIQIKIRFFFFLIKIMNLKRYKCKCFVYNRKWTCTWWVVFSLGQSISKTHRIQTSSYFSVLNYSFFFTHIVNQRTSTFLCEYWLLGSYTGFGRSNRTFYYWNYHWQVRKLQIVSSCCGSIQNHI